VIYIVFNLQETKEIDLFKLNSKITFEELRHKNAMKELDKQLEIAKAGG